MIGLVRAQQREHRVGVQHAAVGERRAASRAATGRAAARPRRPRRARATARSAAAASARAAELERRAAVHGVARERGRRRRRSSARAAPTRPRRRSAITSASSSRDCALLEQPDGLDVGRSAARSAASAVLGPRGAAARAPASQAPPALLVRAPRVERTARVRAVARALGVVAQRPSRDAQLLPATPRRRPRLVRRPAAGDERRSPAPSSARRVDHPRSDGQSNREPAPSSEWRRLPTTRPWCPGSRALRRAWCTGPRTGTSSRRRRR